ncbi:ABC-2 type transport system permease protein [Enterococcus sp. PF1-24]|uniref:ABC transporter permease n=1 Tax=unclassified Enterococcus TaxID=2608891 RepID=UPI00247627FC|nr:MULTISPECIES: ABC transporter permease [unclassified Enterococcus]MDH6365562.1 ABC-2 type transport system permease protein [Enterococcus sp. PFB1-1]MDH6402648.1 ABC-2 type transport system permease protein [Enterococcus sp. PF1-24]
MGNFFQKRLATHQRRLAKYLRYVFNDHFMLVLLFLLGGFAFYYPQFLASLPENSPLIAVAILVVWLAVLMSGNLATLTEEADKVFLLPKELQMQQYLVRSFIYSCIFPFVLLAAVMGLSMPLLSVALGQPLSQSVGYLLTLWVLKVGQLIVRYYGLFQHSQQQQRMANLSWLVLSVVSLAAAIFIQQWLGLGIALIGVVGLFWLYAKNIKTALDWEKMISQEAERMHRIYQFINLFTDVPGISGSVKRRKYLDPLLARIKKVPSNTYFYLYCRRMLRGSEFSGLYIRLLVIGGGLLFFLGDLWFILGIGLLFIYLIGFQLIPLYNQFDYMVLTQLYPISMKQKVGALQKLMAVLLVVVAVIFGGIAIVQLNFALEGFAVVACLLAEVAVFIKFYLPSRVAKMDNKY